MASLRVFVVDDDPAVADATALLLTSAGFEVTTFYEPEHLIQQASTSPPHIVVTDYMMPNMNGLELAKWVTKNYPACKTLVLSGQAALIDDAGAGSEYVLLHKPITRDNLVAAIKGACSL